MSTEKSTIEVKTFFDGAQDITDAFVFLISRKNSRKASSESAPHLASEEDSEYNTDTKDINCLPSGYTLIKEIIVHEEVEGPGNRYHTTRKITVEIHFNLKPTPELIKIQ